MPARLLTMGCACSTPEAVVLAEVNRLNEELRAERERQAQLEQESAVLAHRLQTETDERHRLEQESLALARRLQREYDGLPPEDDAPFEVHMPPEEDSEPPASAETSNGEPSLRALVAGLTTAERHVECCVCFESLHEGPTVTLTLGGKNACAHFFHEECARDVQRYARGQRSAACPQCRQRFDGVRALPKVSDDPDGWFFCVDVEGDGRLSRQQVLNVLVTQFAIDLDKLEAAMPSLWARWDIDGSGFVSKLDFLHPERGLLHFVRKELLHERVRAPHSGSAAEWFAHFDDNRSGRLTRDQLLRALCKSSPELTTQTVAGLLQPLGLLPAPSWVDPLGLRSEQPHTAETTTLEEFLQIDAVLMNTLQYHRQRSERQGEAAEGAAVEAAEGAAKAEAEAEAEAGAEAGAGAGAEAEAEAEAEASEGSISAISRGAPARSTPVSQPAWWAQSHDPPPASRPAWWATQPRDGPRVMIRPGVYIRGEAEHSLASSAAEPSAAAGERCFRCGGTVHRYERTVVSIGRHEAGDLGTQPGQHVCHNRCFRQVIRARLRARSRASALHAGEGSPTGVAG